MIKCYKNIKITPQKDADGPGWYLGTETCRISRESFVSERAAKIALGNGRFSLRSKVCNPRGCRLRYANTLEV